MKTHDYAAKTAMLIHKPAAKVFEAFINPEVTSKFWFTKSTGKLERGKQVEWTWEMYGHTIPVTVLSIIPDEKIIIEWGNYDEKSTVEWTFKAFDDSKTFVKIVNRGFEGKPEEIITQIKDSTEGFTIVLAGLKAYLEYGVELNLVADRFPKELGQD